MKPLIRAPGLCGRIALSILATLLLPILHAAGNDMDEFSKAVLDDNAQRVRELLDKNPALLNGDEKTGYPLCGATFFARKEVIKLLISRGADVQKTTHQYLTPKGTDDQMPKALSVTPLHIAAYQGYADVTQILLDAKADPMAKSEDGTTPLHTAAAHDRSEVVKLLIAANADVNALDLDGATPLHYAASLETQAALVASGADMRIKAGKGEFAGKTLLEIRESLNRLSTLAPDWGKSDVNIPANLAQDVRMLKYMTYALRSFSEKHGSFPSDLTAAALEKSFKNTVSLKGNTANDFFRQLLFTTDFAESVGAVATGTGVSGKTDWTFSYVPGGAFHENPGRPVVLVPLLDGERRFDVRALKGRAVILFADCSVRHFPIQPDGRVLIDGMDIFDLTQPFWKNSKPDIKWPQPRGK